MDENFILRVTGLNKKFGDLEVLKDVSLTMKPGEVISIIGPSGTGKSTFLRCLNYLEKPTRGTITIDGVTVDSGHARHQDIYALRQKTAMVFQNYNLFKNKTEPLAQDMDRLSEAVTVAQNSDVIILCLGLDETLEGEEGDTGNSYASGDKEDLQLPLCQRRLMEVVAQTGKPVILCMMAGSDIDLSFAQKHFEGILQLWYPGARGGNAVAEILFGKESPSGKLPVTFYETLSELPSFEDYSMSGRTYRYMKGKAQYPFGYGLTYGKAEVRSVEVVETETGANVFVKVENTGERDICEVLQIYIKCENSIYAVPNPQLCGFCRVKLYKEERKTLQVHIPGEAFTVVDEEGRHIAGGKHYTIYAGFSQPDAKSEELMGMSPVKVEFRKR